MAFVSKRFTPGFRLIDGSDLNNMVDQLNAGPGSGPTYFVDETVGSDAIGNNGQNPNSPLKTLDQALVLEAAALTAKGLSSVGRNAVVAFWGTQHRTSSLAWNLPATHLFGLGGTQRRGKRARISITGSAGFNNLVSVTAQGCQFQNFGTFYGWPNTSAALICWSDTAGHSTYNNVEFMGFGDGTVTTGSANLTGSRAFKFSSSTGESSWYNCVFGVDTEQRNAANFTLEIAGGAPRLTFENCDFESFLGSSGTGSSHLLIGAAGIDRYCNFKSCRFISDVDSTGSTMAQAFNISGSAGGTVLFDQCTSNGATALQTSPTTNAVMNMTLATTGGGKAHEIF